MTRSMGEVLIRGKKAPAQHLNAFNRPKMPYRDEDSAHRAAYKATITSGTMIVSYQCQFCGYWHIGHLTKKT